jgi:glutaredoxin-dependent peroxiredoxin
MGAQVYGVSVDSTWAHDAWRTQLGLPDDVVLLSDFNRDLGRAYELLTTSASGAKDILRRAVVVISPDGKVIYRWDVPDPPRLPTPDEVLDALRGTAAVP